MLNVTSAYCCVIRAVCKGVMFVYMYMHVMLACALDQ